VCLTSLLFAGAASPRRQAAADVAPSSNRTQEVAASRSGFTPSVINARKGEAIQLRLTSRDQEHCFAVDAFRVEKRVVPGRATTVAITPDRAGTFPFYCCLESGAAAEAERGRLVVAE
jgi:heme/copper-type cytochrome/quinol oxidase subunit 2